MEKVGINIEKMQELINTPMIPPPVWASEWQTEAEHILFLANNAKDKGDIDELRELDHEAARMVTSRITRITT